MINMIGFTKTEWLVTVSLSLTLHEVGKHLSQLVQRFQMLPEVVRHARPQSIVLQYKGPSGGNHVELLNTCGHVAGTVAEL